MRTDIQSMSPGRAMAQASHAANAFIEKYGKRKEVKEWQKETKQGFGTVIVLGAIGLQIDTIFQLLKNSFPQIAADHIIDPDYRLSVPFEIYQMVHDHPNYNYQHTFSEDGKTVIISIQQLTCSYIFGEKTEIEGWFEHLKLHP
jgi:hypothetical protein